MKWISVKDKLPDVGAVVIVKGKPYDNEDEKIGIATLINYGYFVEAESSFGWLGNIYANEGEFVNEELEGVTHWAKIPWEDLQ